MLRLPHAWRDKLSACAIDIEDDASRIEREWDDILLDDPDPDPAEEVGDTHDHIEDAEILEPPPDGEDQQKAHGGDDDCQDVEDAPSREDASGESACGESAAADSAESSTDPSDGDATAQGAEFADESTGPSDEAQDGECDEADGDADDREREREPESERPHGQINHAQAFDLDALRERRLGNAFATIVAKVAEDLAGWPIEGDDEWDIQAIMERQITHRPLSQCRQSREREAILLVLDTSGSCAWQARFFSRLADMAERAGDVEIYYAPNAGKWETHAWPWNRRKILFFGDFDGGDLLVEASSRNKIYWFSCENRYDDLTEHEWNSHELREFRGKYLPCQGGDDFLRLAKKIR